MSSVAEPGFDRILIQQAGAWRAISLTEFLELPLSTRIRHVIERTIVFHERGREVDQKQALAMLRRLRAEARG